MSCDILSFCPGGNSYCVTLPPGIDSLTTASLFSLSHIHLSRLHAMCSCLLFISRRLSVLIVSLFFDLTCDRIKKSKHAASHRSSIHHWPTARSAFGKAFPGAVLRGGESICRCETFGLQGSFKGTDNDFLHL
jgi:hypothetical protein